LGIEVWVTELKGVRLSFGYRIVREDGAEILQGNTRHVCTTITDKPQRLPEALIESLQPYWRGDGEVGAKPGRSPEA
jgi:acyl-CoA thioesterase FadM